MSHAVSEEDLAEEFSFFGVEIDNEHVISKLQELCTLHRLDAGGMATEWIAYKHSKKGVDLGVEILESFERERLSKKIQKTPKPIKKESAPAYSMDSLPMDVEGAEELYNAYGGQTPSKGAISNKRQHTPDNNFNKRLTGPNRSPAVPFSPSSFSPASATPAKKYNARNNRGEVVASHGPVNAAKWNGTGQSVSIEHYNTEQSLSRNFKYMFQKLTEKFRVLDAIIEDMADHLKTEHKIGDFSHVALPTQEDVTVVGRICCDSQGKLNAKSVLMEGSVDVSCGKCVYYGSENIEAKEETAVLDAIIEGMADHLKTEHKIEDFSHVALPTQEDVTVVGRICCDGQGKLNAKSVVMEGSVDVSYGKCVYHGSENIEAKEETAVLDAIIEGMADHLKAEHKIEDFSHVALPTQEDVTVVGRICCDSQGKLNSKSVVMEVLDAMIEDMADHLKAEHKIEDFSHVALPTQEDVTVVCRICCDSQGKLNANSVVMEGSVHVSYGKCVYYGSENIEAKEETAVLDAIIEDMADHLKAEHKIEDFSHVALPTQEDVTVVGRICCDSQGKLNAKSVVMEGSVDVSSGKTIPVDLTKLKEYGLFPGQVVAMDGLNNTGKAFIASKLYDSVPLPLPDVSSNEPGSTRLSMLIAAGPFSTSDSLSYEPLTDLVQQIQTVKPDVCVLMGPFVDCKNTEIENGRLSVTYEELFKTQMEQIARATENLGTRIIVLPSYRDIHHDVVYPQPPFRMDKDYKHIQLMPDPCTLKINDIVFGLTSTDVLFHLGAEEISFPPGSSDRLGRLTQHLLNQHSYYPLYPPNEEMSIDYEQFYQHCTMPVTPHVLVIPSEFKQFIKDIKGCCCINPGRLTKGLTGSTFAKLVVQVNNLKNAQSIVPNITAQIVRI